MATLTPFHYRHGDSFLHVLDARFKIVLMVMFSLSLIHTSFPGLFSLTLLLALLFLYVRIPITSVIAEMRYFFILLLVVFLLRLISTPGEPLVKIPWVTLSKQGLREGVLKPAAVVKGDRRRVGGGGDADPDMVEQRGLVAEARRIGDVERPGVRQDLETEA